LEQLKERIRARRKELRLTQADLAARVGVSPTAVTDWETGKSRPWENLVALAKALEVTTDWLTTGAKSAHEKKLEQLQLMVDSNPDLQRAWNDALAKAAESIRTMGQGIADSIAKMPKERRAEIEEELRAGPQ
jgi:transcriptional regulator with XRE-family HTH domain